MPGVNDKAAIRKRKDGPMPAVPPSAIRMAKIGGTIALIAAAAISAQTLVNLGHLLGLHDKIAWLLPVSLDVYAATSIWVGYRIPSIHPAARIARRDARLALGLTVCCNALFHLLLLAGSQLPHWLTDTLLIIVGALPPLVVERIFHLQMAVRDGDGTHETAPISVPAQPAPARPPVAAAHTSARSSGTEPAQDGTRPGTAARTAPERTDHTDRASAAVVPLNAGTRTPFGTWVDRAIPLWNAYVDKHHAEPIAAVIGNQVRLAYPEDPNLPTSDRWDRKLCGAVREAVGDAGQGAPARAEEAEEEPEAVAL